ncbi:flagellar basal body P-ring formation chaperone FlgA [Marimonas arenosa]|uniref:Flagella basal body P-ring formation protein FlgA n=1 Tax=Marimonas arenosa TaxID=1795305 RepID=A0AAE4B4T1_9RHOB|nr:flagellar basal body P-ring formation chaperone FlgA [Marimonas arenosa]MDQ2090560.1 flagellar basal body P-ring formation chaperone FlgA [Marimonas arenosa]
MRTLAVVALFWLAGPVAADTVVPVRTIRAQEVIAPGDLQLRAVDVAGGFTAVDEVAGLEAKVALYPGRPVRPVDVGPPAVIERNQVVPLTYARGGLSIRTEGRALDRAAVGDRVKVMNLASRNTVMGRVQTDGSISVSE